MDGIILAAGKGTRMKDLTLNTPKPLLMVQGRPLLEWSLLTLRPTVEHVLVVVSYLKEQIAAYMAQQTLFEHYTLVEQPQPLGTGHALQCCQPHLTSADFIVLNGDDLYQAAAVAQLARYPAAILAATRDEDGARFGVIVPDTQGNVTRLHEKPPAGLYAPPVQINIGGYRMDHSVFELPLTPHETRGEYEITQYVTELAQRQPVAIVDCPFWFPVGTPELLAEAQTLDVAAAIFG